MSARTFCVLTASTKRNADLGNGRTGAPVTYLEELAISPLWPLTPETIRQLDINSPREMKQTYHAPVTGGDLPDVREGDVLTVDGVDYPIFHVSEWGDLINGIPCLEIIVSLVKGT